MRLIDANTLKQAIDAYANEPVKQNDRRWDTRCTAIILDAKGIIDDAPTIGGWISVKDRMPEESGRYIVYAVDGGALHHTTVAQFQKSFHLSGRMAYWKVTHWMPIPEPPKEET